MTDVMIATPNGQMPAYLAVPAGGGSWPGVVVVDDFAGMSHDLRLRNVAAPVPGWLSQAKGGASAVPSAPQIGRWPMSHAGRPSRRAAMPAKRRARSWSGM